jgi:uncharacterized protein YegP (UPF0339 family)
MPIPPEYMLPGTFYERILMGKTHGGKYSVWRSVVNNEWYFTLYGANGETIAHSEGHKNEADVSDVVIRYFPGWEEIEHEHV